MKRHLRFPCPSTLLTCSRERWSGRHRDNAFRAIVIRNSGIVIAHSGDRDRRVRA
jgi:hypothetical protein